MKRKIIIIASSFAAIIGMILLFLSHHPRIVGEIFEHCKVIDLRKNLPKGRFQKVSIVLPINKNTEYVSFEVPDDKMEEFEAGFRRCVRDAHPIKGFPHCLNPDLRIVADKEEFFVEIGYSDEGVAIYGGFFHRGFSSRELRKVFYGAGLEYSAGGPKEKEINEPNYQEIIREIGIKAAEYGRMVKEAKEGENTPNQPLQKHSD
ncbi:MAG: hypothetical protein JW806_07080 [Sedimentisphaerales bacterium]|nr:hypothetical protein [Sedimentisphaerales bacterium]